MHQEMANNRGISLGEPWQKQMAQKIRDYSVSCAIYKQWMEMEIL